MAFLNNGGDIIVDAVLTDVGRANLAKGLPVATQFALGDAEIDYSLYNPNLTSGSAYYDVDLMQTPVFEPSTYSQTAMGSKLFSYADNTLQFLPVLKMNQSTKVDKNLTTIGSSTQAVNVLTTDSMISLVTSTTIASNTSYIDGRRNILIGTNITNTQAQTAITSRFIRVDQGYDSQTVTIPLGDLEETSFSVYVNRLFLKVLDNQYNASVQPIIVANPFLRSQATDIYKVSTTNPNFFGAVDVKGQVNNVTQLATSLATNTPNQVGRQLQFSLQASDFLATNLAYYFSTYGKAFTGTIDGVASPIVTGDAVSYITTYVRVVGDNYGFATDIPIKLFYKA